MNITNVVEYVSNAMERVKTPVNFLPPLLLRCTSLMRSGLSAYEITSEIIQDNGVLGIPTGYNTDGSINLINATEYNRVKKIINAIKTKGVVQIVIPGNSLLIQTNGGNAGGPVLSTGTNLLDSTAYGIMH